MPITLPVIRILNLPVHDVCMDTALEAIDGFIAEGGPHHVVTADASMLVMASEDSFLRTIVSKADLVTPDGAGILWAARRIGNPLRERVSGVDIVDRLCRRSAERGYKIYFLGGAPGVAEQAAERMREKYPGANIVGTRDGFFSDADTDAVLGGIRSAGAEIVCVALGIPKQEKWIEASRNLLDACVYIGVGGTLDVLSGNTRRAPRWMQKMSLEWLWRLANNPSKISKVKLLPRFVQLVRKTG